MKQKRSKKRKRGRSRGFWKDWHVEQVQWWEEFGPMEQPAPGQPPFHPPPPMAGVWRQYFHDYTGHFPEDHWAFGSRRFSPWHQGVDTFNPFVASLLSKGGGLLPLLVLHLLAQAPRYGNELMDLITEGTQGRWMSNPGAIYPLMAKLENEGLVAGKWTDPRKRTTRVYQLTADGEEELQRLKAIIRPKLQEAIQVLTELAQMVNGKGPADDVIYL
jgi:DNA-binding PadR family transcriptional regulator